jgi:lipopolysaccharide transport system ATP-binding protein
MSNNRKNGFAIEIQNVSKLYYTYSKPQHRLLEILSGGKKRYATETRALDDVSFTLERGARLGIVGANGSGKTTLLKLLAGVLTPSSGAVQVRGRVSALLDLGTGFNPDLSGMENIRQFCMLHGMHREAIEEAVPHIVQFSELRDVMDHAVKTYSAGMAMRLGFSCAVYVKPDILIIDEALSVGDAYFQNKCVQKIKSMLDVGTTFIYVTHSADAIRALCNQGIWMERGQVRLAGSSSKVGAAYQSEVYRRMVRAGIGTEETTKVDSESASEIQQERMDRTRHKAFEERVAPLRTGSGEARIQNIALIGNDGVDTDSVAFHARCRVRVFYLVELPLPGGSALTLGVTDSSGRQVLHFNSASQGVFLSTDALGELRVIEFEFDNPLCPGEYGLIAGLGSFVRNPRNNGQRIVEEVVDYCVGGARFTVRYPDQDSDHDLWGIVHVPFSASEYVLDGSEAESLC